MRYLIAALLTISCLYIKAQDAEVVLWTENVDGEIVIFGKNRETAPYTAVLTIGGENIIAQDQSPMMVVLPGGSENQEVTRLSFIPGAKSSFSFEYKLFRGDVKNAFHDDNSVYELPFEKGEAFPVGQGYFGGFSHNDKEALDFDMPVGTPVCASRDGIVVAVKEDSDKGCKSPKCQEEANYITVLHDDGSFADYVHLRKNGSKVRTGDKVSAGQHIGFSGETGWASGPHLHFEVYVPTTDGRRTVSTTFSTNAGTVRKLEEGTSYKRP